MNKEDYVSLEVAKKLKEKGFNEPCLYFYRNGSLYTLSEDVICSECDNIHDDIIYPVPSLYEAKKWIWDNHELFISSFLEPPFTKPYKFTYCIQDAKNTLDDYGDIVEDKLFDSMQEAIMNGIMEALKLI